MKVLRVCVAAAAVALSVVLAGCSGSGADPGSGPSASGQSSVTAGPGQAGGPATPSAAASQKATKDQPVPKVQRSGQAPSPARTAKPASTDGKVRYSDGVSLRVLDVSFGKESEKGPGSFPGRQFAVLTLEISNGSAKPINLDTTVLTVLDKNGKAVAPVYAEQADVRDFAGIVKPGKSVKARYAFAVPKSSRSKVTVVVDFDNVHTSAVFRGKLD